MPADSLSSRLERIRPVAERLERWTDEVRRVCNPGSVPTFSYRRIAEALLAFASREAAERIEAGRAWEEYERLRGAAFDAHFACGEHRDDDGPYEPLAKAATEAGAALDAFVRRLIARLDASPPE